MKKAHPTKAALAERAWTLMFNILTLTSAGRSQSLLRRGLTPNDAKALWSLNEKAGRPIGELAREWGCDPSNATFIIDRLERAELAERRPSVNDRRIKLVALTPLGSSTRAQLDAEFHTPPPQVLKLDTADLRALERVLRKVASQEGGG